MRAVCSAALRFLCYAGIYDHIRSLYALVSPAQTMALGFMIRMLEITSRGERINLDRRIDEMYLRISREGPDFVYPGFFTTCGRFLNI